MLSSSAFFAVSLQCASSISPVISFNIARVESHFNPYAIAEMLPRDKNPPGHTKIISHYPVNKEYAKKIISTLSAKGHRFSVGLMQITSSNFQRYKVNGFQLLDPCINLAIFEKIFIDCYKRGGSLPRALSCYYSGNFVRGQKIEEQFRGTSYVQRVGITTGRFSSLIPLPDVFSPVVIIKDPYRVPLSQSKPIPDPYNYSSTVISNVLRSPIDSKEK